MRTSPTGIKAISLREGTILRGYNDSKGLLTVGVGHLVLPGEPYTLGGKITQAESDRLLQQDLHIAEAAVNDGVNAALTQNQFDALVSFVVNIGIGGFKKSTVLKRLNARDYDGAAKALMNWVTPPEITGRRKSEQKQFLTPYKTSAQVPQVPSTIVNNLQDDGKPIDTPAPDFTEGERPTLNVENIENAKIEAPKPAAPLPQSKPVQVTVERVSVFAKVGAGIAAVTGIGINFGNLVTTRLNDMTLAQLGYVLGGVAILGVALFLYDRAAKRAHEKTLAKMLTASDPAQNTVELREQT